ncbi:MAG: LysR family transcriptional regulator [Bacteroidota bacterium]
MNFVEGNDGLPRLRMEIRHIKYFLAVAENLHFRKAAERLHISQPGLSRQIRQLEEELGYALLERNTKRVELTPAGAFLQREWKQWLEELDRTREHARLLHNGLEGEIKIGFVGSAMQNIIPDILLLMKQAHPGIRFSLEEMSNAKQVQELGAKRLDVGFVRLKRVEAPLLIRPVLEDTFSLVLPADHPLQADTFQDMTSLNGEGFILFDATYSPDYYDQVFSICEDAGFSPHLTHKSVHASTIFRLVANGFGVSIVPTALQAGFDLGVKFIELKHIPQRAILYMSWSPENGNPCMSLFMSHVPDLMADPARD